MAEVEAGRALRNPGAKGGVGDVIDPDVRFQLNICRVDAALGRLQKRHLAVALVAVVGERVALDGGR